MGSVEFNDRSNCHNISRLGEIMMNPFGFGSAGKFQLRGALRENDDEDWWKYSTVEFEQISPQPSTMSNANIMLGIVARVRRSKRRLEIKKRNKMKMMAPVAVESKSSEDPLSNPKQEQRVSPLLKLDYDGVLEAWSDIEPPFPDDILGSDGAGMDSHKIRFVRRKRNERCMCAKRRNRLFSKNIRYQVRKLSAVQRPLIKGRFVRRPNARNLNGLQL